MTAPRRTDDLDVEREVDLARWRRAIVALWWLPVAGLVAGAFVGFVISLGGSNTYKASALISLGQPVSPGGVVIASFATNPRAVSQITSSAFAQDEAAHKAGMHPGALRGNVSVATVGTQTGAGTARSTPLISLTVVGRVPKKVAAASNALANIVVQQTTEPYVALKIATFTKTQQSVNAQVVSLNHRLAVITAAEKAAKNLDPFQQLVIVSEEDNAQARLGNAIAQQETLQQQLAFAKTVESAKVIEPAKAVKSSARSHRTSALVGALIGLILGAIAAIVGDTRLRKPQP